MSLRPGSPYVQTLAVGGYLDGDEADGGAGEGLRVVVDEDPVGAEDLHTLPLLTRRAKPTMQKGEGHAIVVMKLV